MFETYQRNLQQPCQEVTTALQTCYRTHHKNGGVQGEACYREELSHKKCLAQMLCHREAYRFYNDRKVPLAGSKWLWSGNNNGDGSGGGGRGGKATCATLVEAFAMPENEMDIPEGVGKEDRDYCRSVVMDLAECMAKKRGKNGNGQ